MQLQTLNAIENISRLELMLSTYILVLAPISAGISCAITSRKAKESNEA